jgi:muramidase (phage lysozyme)
MVVNKNLKAFLDMIAFSEIGTTLLKNSDNGYNVLVGGTLFPSYEDHPRVKVFIKSINNYSTAAGRYQILRRTFDFYKKLLNLKDFSPTSQDLVAIRLIREQHALPDVFNGNISSAIYKVKNIWASLPGAGYNQHENQLASLIQEYTNAGGGIA